MMRCCDLAKVCKTELTSFSDSELVSKVNIINAVDNDNEFEEINEEAESDFSLNHTDVISITEDVTRLKLQKTSSQDLPTYKPKNSNYNRNKADSNKTYFLLNKNNLYPFVEYQGTFIRKSTLLYLLQENLKVSNGC